MSHTWSLQTGKLNVSISSIMYAHKHTHFGLAVYQTLCYTLYALFYLTLIKALWCRDFIFYLYLISEVVVD